MEYATIAGNYYTITSKSGCSVTDATGTLNMTVDAGGQLTVQAPSDKLVLDDEQAIIFKANFNHALAALGLLGGGDKLPAGYTRLEFLESTGTQVIVLPVNKNNPKSLFMSTEVQFTALPAINDGMQEGQNSRFQWGLWGGASSTTAFASVNNASGNLSLGKVGEQWNSWTTCTIGYDAPYHRWGTWGAFRAEDEGAIGPPNITNFVLFGVERYGWFGFFQKVRKKRFVLKADGVTLYRLIPALDPTGTPCMFDRVSKQPFKNSGSGSFIAGVGTVAQLTTLLRRLPATGGALTLSLPAEANTPEVADMLQACYDTKGWTLTVHEYRPAAVATYSLRRVRELVWCRVAACEHGSYANEHGVRYNIEHCAAIFGPHGQDPTDYGYEPFDSVEQAVEAWGLVPYQYPEEELSTET